MTLRPFGELQEDKRLRQMIFVSAVLHVLVIMWVLTSSSLSRSLQPRVAAYTVELVDPKRLGTNLPGGGGKSASTMVEPVPSPKISTLPPLASKRLEPKVAIKEKPKLAPLPQQTEAHKILRREKPIEKPLVKPETEKTKVAEKKPTPQQVTRSTEPHKTAKADEPKPNVKTIAPRAEPKKTETKPVESGKTSNKEVEKKKPEPQKIETKLEKTEPAAEKTEAKPKKAVARLEENSASTRAEVKKTEKNPANTEEIASEDRDQRIAAALARIKAQTQAQRNSTASEGVKGTGPVTKGGEFGEGGGGAVRGIEFLIYTQQLQKRVQENWIVAEKKPGLVASVSFMIQPNGDIQEVEMTQSSGDRAFDQSVVRAIRKAAPFPPPPQSYAQEFATQKIFMNFGGEGRVN